MRTGLKVGFVVSGSRRFLLHKQMSSSSSWMSPVPFFQQLFWKKAPTEIPLTHQQALFPVGEVGTCQCSWKTRTVFQLLLPLLVPGEHPPLGLSQAMFGPLCESAPSPSDPSRQECQLLFPHCGTHVSLFTLYAFPSFPNFFQCKRPRFLSCFSDFHSILSLSCHTALAAVPLPLDSKMSSRVSQGIHQQRVTEGGKLSKVLRSQVDRAGSCLHRVGSQCMDSPLPLPMQADSWLCRTSRFAAPWEEREK